jgi:hypothetical protein
VTSAVTASVASAVACVKVNRRAAVTAPNVAIPTSLGENHPFFAIDVDVTASGFPTPSLHHKKDKADAEHCKRFSKRLKFHLMFSGQRCVLGGPPMAQ